MCMFGMCKIIFIIILITIIYQYFGVLSLLMMTTLGNMTNQNRRFSNDQRFYEILEACKQIPKDDRLILRKYIKEGNDAFISILLDANNKKLQIKIRKFLNKVKQEKKNLGEDQQKDSNLERQRKMIVRPNSVGRLTVKKTIDIQELTQSSKKQKCQGNVLNNVSNANIRNFQRKTLAKQQRYQHQKETKNYHLHFNNAHECPKLQEERQNKYEECQYFDFSKIKAALGLEDKFSQQNIERSQGVSQFKWSALKINIGGSSNTSSLRESREGHFQPNFQNKINEKPSFESILANFQISSNVKADHSKQSLAYEIKSKLLSYYAQQIFQYISDKHFPSSISETAVYFPYRQFLFELEKYLQQKDSKFAMFKENTMQIPVLDPFTNQYEGININNIGLFLNKYCLRKNNDIRNLFIVLDSEECYKISVEKFKRINGWRGSNLIEQFEKVVQKWGENGSITYWQMYRARNEKLFQNFYKSYKQF